MAWLSDNALKVLATRYLRRDRDGIVTETPAELFRRVAKAIAAAEISWGTNEDVARWEEKFYSVTSKLLFLPNSPTLMNAGTTANQLSACFVLPVDDDMSSIFTTLKNAALIQQSGGGTGFNFSHLRPRNDPAVRTGGIAAGSVAFMKVFDAATEHIKQGGIRRGANMGILNIDHPEIEEFIFSKRVPGVLGNFNISVGISDAFMNAMEQDTKWSLVHPNTKKTVRQLPARQLWNDIIESAWRTGDPGMIFLDTINSANPTPALGKIESTNPCGEVPLLPYEPCNLGSVNLTKFIKQTTAGKEVDWKYLEEIIPIAIRFLDNVIEVNDYIIPEIKGMALGNRKIGLGIMGWAELLIQLGIPYDSEDAIRLAGQLMQFIRQKSLEASAELAGQRGVFPNWEKSIYAPNTPVRNATRTSIAPTGTISIIADTSSSIEPLFALAFRRRHVLNDETLYSINQPFIAYLEKQHLFSEKTLEQVMEEGTAESIKELPAEAKNIFKTALEISPSWHLKHQLAFQEYTDNAVSKTINLPESATIADVSDIYMNAWKNKAKGITIFRYNSRGKQVMWQGLKSGIKSCKVCIE
ncbi:MAG: adenosylcobalamin-dependent ribonucleoside-diphosphate reductase [Bacteroidota bacterium]|nr:adenosylcobalamin-dependent ribonucleoside-diphosphate reductase [Bacteroidota bacterium]